MKDLLQAKDTLRQEQESTKQHYRGLEHLGTASRVFLVVQNMLHLGLVICNMRTRYLFREDEAQVCLEVFILH